METRSKRPHKEISATDFQGTASEKKKRHAQYDSSKVTLLKNRTVEFGRGRPVALKGSEVQHARVIEKPNRR